MAWPSPVAAHQTATANQYNGLLDAVQHWGGNVDAASYQLTGLSGLVAAAGAVIDATAGGGQWKGPLGVVGGDTDGIKIQSGAGWMWLRAHAAGDGALSTSGNAIWIQAVDGSRAIVIDTASGRTERISSASGSVQFFNAGILVDRDAVFSGGATFAGAVTAHGTLQVVSSAPSNPSFTVRFPANGGANQWMSLVHDGFGQSINMGITSDAIDSSGWGPRGYLWNSASTISLIGTVWVQAAVWATAYNPHGSGSTLADIRKNFLRRDKVQRGTDKMPSIEEPIQAGGWNLVAGDDGLHLFVKRSETQVAEHVIPWEQFRNVE